MLGSPRRPQLRHLSPRLRRPPLLRVTETALTGSKAAWNSGKNRGVLFPRRRRSADTAANPS